MDKYIQAGSPNQNAYTERFNKTYGKHVLKAYLFENLDVVRHITENWLQDYYHFKPHDSLCGLPPVMYRTFKEKTATRRSLFRFGYAFAPQRPS